MTHLFLEKVAVQVVEPKRADYALNMTAFHKLLSTCRFMAYSYFSVDFHRYFVVVHCYLYFSYAII